MILYAHLKQSDFFCISVLTIAGYADNSINCVLNDYAPVAGTLIVPKVLSFMQPKSKKCDLWRGKRFLLLLQRHLS